MFVCLYRFRCSLYIKGKQCFLRGFLNFHRLVIYRELEVRTAEGTKQTTGFEQNAQQNVIEEIRFQVCPGSESFPLRWLGPTLYPVAPPNMQIYFWRANFSTKARFEIIHLRSFYMCANKGVVLKVTYGQRVQSQRTLSTKQSMVENSFYWLQDALGLILDMHKVSLLYGASLWTLRWRHVWNVLLCKYV